MKYSELVWTAVIAAFTVSMGAAPAAAKGGSSNAKVKPTVGVADFYVVFACYKLAVILEGIHARYLMGKTVGEGFSEIGGRVDAMAEAAMDLAQHSSIPALRG